PPARQSLTSTLALPPQYLSYILRRTGFLGKNSFIETGSETGGYMLGLRSPLFLLFLASVFVTISPAVGQRVTGDFVRSVRDASGDVIADASVRLVHQSTSLERSMVTDSSGVYRASTMEIGVYTVEASKSGFKTVSRRNVELHVNEVLRIDLTMDVGDVTE